MQAALPAWHLRVTWLHRRPARPLQAWFHGTDVAALTMAVGLALALDLVTAVVRMDIVAVIMRSAAQDVSQLLARVKEAQQPPRRPRMAAVRRNLCLRAVLVDREREEQAQR